MITFTDVNTFVGFVGTVLGIIAFFWQFGPQILAPTQRWLGIPGKEAEPVLPAKDHAALRRQFRIGILLALAAVLFWSFSHTSFRTNAAKQASALPLAGAICGVGGLAIAAMGLVGRLRDDSRRPFKLFLLPLATYYGVGMVLSTAIEFVLYILAMHYISAGQTMALWKTNPLWVLILSTIFARSSVSKVSVAAVFCVLTGVYQIMAPSFKGPAIPDELIGSALAMFGGFTFALYTVCVDRYPLKITTSSASERLFVQAVVLLLTAVLLFATSYAFRRPAGFGHGTGWLVLLNGMRMGAVYVCYTEAIKRTRQPILVACIIALEVPVTMMIEYLWFGRAPGNTVLIGSGIIIIGILSIVQENQFLKSAVVDKD